MVSELSANANSILNSPTPISTPPSPNENPLIALNISAQINETLTPSTFLQWRAQFEALLIGYNLLDYVTGNYPCPVLNDTPASSLQKTHWVKQDKLILSAILASTTSTITSFISSAKTSQEACQKLSTSKSRTRAMQLKEDLTLIKKENRTVQEYLQIVKSLADEIALVDHPISDDDLTFYILNGLGPDYHEIATPIRALEKARMFEELHDLLVGHEAYLRRLEATTQHLVATTNYSNRFAGNRPGGNSQNDNNSYRCFNKSQGTRNNNGSRDNRKQSNNGGKSTGLRRYQLKCQLCDQLGHVAKQCPEMHFLIVLQPVTKRKPIG